MRVGRILCWNSGINYGLLIKWHVFRGSAMTIRSRVLALTFSAFLASFAAAPVQASVLYNLTFDNGAGTVSEGTGVLTLNLATVAAAYGLNTSNTSIFTSLSTSNIDGNGTFLVTPSNLASFYIQTSLATDPPAGHIYTLTVTETEPTIDQTSGDVLFIDLYTNSWQIHGQYDSTVDSGKLIVAGPSLGTSATPLPPALPLFASGLGALGVLLRRAKRKRAALAA